MPMAWRKYGAGGGEAPRNLPFRYSGSLSMMASDGDLRIDSDVLLGIHNPGCNTELDIFTCNCPFLCRHLFRTLCCRLRGKLRSPVMHTSLFVRSVGLMREDDAWSLGREGWQLRESGLWNKQAKKQVVVRSPLVIRHHSSAVWEAISPPSDFPRQHPMAQELKQRAQMHTEQWSTERQGRHQIHVPRWFPDSNSGSRPSLESRP